MTTRRHFLQTMGAATAASLTPRSWTHSGDARAAERPKRPVAAVVTIYRQGSHSDVILGKILRGWKYDGGPGPDLQLAALYVDQYGPGDMARDFSREYGFPLVDRIEDALTLGTDRVAVDGVISIGEHGEYPWNEKEQHLYPRKRFFREIADTMERRGRVVPVFNDKHLGPEWADAIWMYRRAQELKIPFMAGSSLAVGARQPQTTFPRGERIAACLGIGYSGLDIYGFHTLEFLQVMLERRAGGETGVAAVQSLSGEAIPDMIANGTLDGELLDAGLAASQTTREQLLASKLNDAVVFLIEYRDGLKAPVLMLPSVAAAISASWRVAGQPPVAVRAMEHREPHYPHFAELLRGIEAMVHAGRPTYPVERTLLTTGLLDSLLTSRQQSGKRLPTPHLAIQYAS